MHNNELYNKIINLRKRRVILKNRIKELKLRNYKIPKELTNEYIKIKLNITQLTFLNEVHFGK